MKSKKALTYILKGSEAYVVHWKDENEAGTGQKA